LAVTQFEALSARSAFPCYDEPLFRSVFKMIIEINKDEEGIMAVSNMPTIVVRNTPTKTIYDFFPSPNMSSYLVAFAIGEFEYIEKRALNTNFRVLTTKGFKEQGKFAIDVGINCTKWLNEFFEIPYNLPKMDQV
jgi:puromycin-sensitive aminopeptidase